MEWLNSAKCNTYKTVNVLIERDVSDRYRKQGRIHSYLSQLQVGKGRILGHLIIWAGALRPKTAKTKKVKCDGRTDGQTDQRINERIDKAGRRVA